jgi:RNA polymerase sigma factor (sigma-70 family)
LLLLFAIFPFILIAVPLFDEASVLLAIRKGDPEGLSLVYTEYRESFISWCMKNYSCTLEEAKDIYQNTIVIFYENTLSGKFTATHASFKTYLFAIGKNKAHETLRRNDRWVRFEYSAYEDTSSDETNEFTEEDMQLAAHALNALGDPCRQLLELYFFKREKMEDIARTMGYKNTDTAKNQKYKCLIRLRSLFHEQRTGNPLMA